MGVDLYGLDFLLKYRNVVRGDTLWLGRQGFHIRPDDGAREVLRRYDKNAKIETFIEDGGYATALFHYLGSDTVTSLDASNYEGAQILHDLNVPISPDLENSFDCIFDGGTIEHVFDAPRAFENVRRMLRPGGLFLLIDGANNFLGHGFYQFSPELLWRAFSLQQGFLIEKMQLVNLSGMPNPCDVDDPAVVGSRGEIRITGASTYILMAARKMLGSPTRTAAPIQSDYEATWRAEVS